MSQKKEVSPLYYFSRAVITKYNKLGGLNQQKCIVSQIEAGSPKSQYWQGHVPSETGRVDSFPVSSGAHQSLVFLGSQQHHLNLCLCHHMAFPLTVCVPIPLFLGHKSHWIRTHPNDFIIT